MRLHLQTITPIILIVIAVYWGVWNFSFVYDDSGHFTENAFIKTLAPFEKFFFEPGVFTGNIDNPQVWRPIGVLAAAISWKLFGYHAGWYHLLNLVLHLVNILLAYSVIFLLFRRKILAGLTVLLWGIHPVLIESVTWISAQNNLLWSLFFLVAAVSIINRWPLWVSYLTFALSLLTKESAIGGILIIPVLLFLIQNSDKRSWKRAFFQSLPYFAIGFAYLVLRFSLVSQLGYYDWGTVFISPFVVGYYLYLIFWPKNLMVLDALLNNLPFSQIVYNILVIMGIFSILILLLIIWISFRKKWNPEFLGFTMFISFLLPVIQIVPSNGGILGTRVLYLPLLGLTLGVLSLISRIQFIKQFGLISKSALVAPLVLVLMFSAYSRNQEWKNPETLWLSALKIHPNIHVPYSGLAYYYLNEGRDPQKALDWSKRQLDLWPEHDLAWINLAAAYSQLGEYEKAEKEFLAILAKVKLSQSTEAIVLSNLANLYQKWGIVRQGIYGRVTGAARYVNVYDSRSHFLIKRGKKEDNETFNLFLDPGNYYLEVGGLGDEFLIEKGKWRKAVVNVW